MLRILLITTVLASGCLLNSMKPSQKLNERVQEYSDATRWNRIDIASQMVDPAYRTAFVARHRAWGRQVEVADAELVYLQIDPDGDTGRSVIAYSWYDLSSMSLARTTVRQEWNLRGGYRVANEFIVDGEAGLLPGAERDAPADDPMAQDAPLASAR